jgi:hypothetical protein
MNQLKIAFDVDDTLIVPSIATGFEVDVPNYGVLCMFKFFAEQGHHMIIWSGGGPDYARMWAGKLGLHAEIRSKEKSPDVDIAFDDCDVDLAKVNVKIKRINNGISRRDWNEHGTKED